MSILLSSMTHYYYYCCHCRRCRIFMAIAIVKIIIIIANTIFVSEIKWMLNEKQNTLKRENY